MNQFIQFKHYFQMLFQSQDILVYIVINQLLVTLYNFVQFVNII